MKTKPTSTVSREALIALCEQESLLGQKCKARLNDLSRTILHLPHNWEQKLDDDLAYLGGICKGREALRNTRNQLQQSAGCSTMEFQASTLFLHECQSYLVSDPSLNERIHVVTGPITRHGVAVMSKMECVKMEEQSRVFVKADDDDQDALVHRLGAQHGHLVLGVFHSHIMKGAKATRPSDIDVSAQDRYQEKGWNALTGIFSLDGFVRFFTNNKPFEIELYGRGAELIESKPCMKTFRLPG